MGGSHVDEARFFSVVPSNWTWGNMHKLEQRKFHLNRRSNFFLWGWHRTGTGCPEGLWSLLWRYSRFTWILSCAIYSRESAFSKGWTRWSSQKSSSLYDSVILRVVVNLWSWEQAALSCQPPDLVMPAEEFHTDKKILHQHGPIWYIC